MTSAAENTTDRDNAVHDFPSLLEHVSARGGKTTTQDAEWIERTLRALVSGWPTNALNLTRHAVARHAFTSYAKQATGSPDETLGHFLIIVFKYLHDWWRERPVERQLLLERMQTEPSFRTEGVKS